MINKLTDKLKTLHSAVVGLKIYLEVVVRREGQFHEQKKQRRLPDSTTSWETTDCLSSGRLGDRRVPVDRS